MGKGEWEPTEPAANPTPATHLGTEAALDSSTAKDRLLWLCTAPGTFHGRKDTLSSQHSLFCDTGMLWDCPAWDCARPTSHTSWEPSNLLPVLTNCWNKLGSYRCFHLHPTLWHFSPDKIRSSPASSTTALGQHHSESRTPVIPHRNSPWPSIAQEGEKDSSAHDAAAHTASLSKPDVSAQGLGQAMSHQSEHVAAAIPFQNLTFLPKGWARPRPTAAAGESGTHGCCQSSWFESPAAVMVLKGQPVPFLSLKPGIVSQAGLKVTLPARPPLP